MSNSANNKFTYEELPEEDCPFGEIDYENSKAIVRNSIPMGKEHLYFTEKNISEISSDEIQANADLVKEINHKINIDKTLFGLVTTYKKPKVSLDKEYLSKSHTENTIEPEHSIDKEYLKNIYNFRIINIDVDHLEPIIPANSRLVIDYREDFYNGAICYYIYYGERYFNQIFVLNNRIIASSFNKKYPDVYLNPEEYLLQGVVTSYHGALLRKNLERK